MKEGYVYLCLESLAHIISLIYFSIEPFVYIAREFLQGVKPFLLRFQVFLNFQGQSLIGYRLHHLSINSESNLARSLNPL